MKKQILYLKSGGYLRISGMEAHYVDSTGTDQYLTEAEQTILAMLVHSDGQTVSYRELYEGYSRQTSFGDINQMVADIKTHMRPELKACIRVVRGKGYRLDLSKFDTQTRDAAAHDDPMESQDKGRDSWQKKLEGEYYGFYLDPIGDGALLGAYLKVEEQVVDNQSTLCVTGVMGIRSDNVFRSDALPETFTGIHTDYYRKYRALKDSFSANDKRCFSVSGTVRICGTVAIICVTTTLESEWTLLLDIEKYLFVEKQKHSGTPYKGGLGLLISLTNSHGKYCCRGALIRRECMKPTIRLSNTAIRDMLKIPDTLNWSPLELDPQLDRKWYNWFMKADE